MIVFGERHLRHLLRSYKEQYAQEHSSESNSKLAVWGALSLYLNFINIFQLLLGLTGEREG